MPSSVTHFHWEERTANKQNADGNAWPKGRADFTGRRGTVVAKTSLEVCKEPSEKQVGCFCGDKQEAKEPFILPFNEELCQGAISLG